MESLPFLVHSAWLTDDCSVGFQEALFGQPLRSLYRTRFFIGGEDQLQGSSRKANLFQAGCCVGHCRDRGFHITRTQAVKLSF